MMMMLMLIRVIWVHSGRGSRRVTASPALPNCDLDHYYHNIIFLFPDHFVTLIIIKMAMIIMS